MAATAQARWDGAAVEFRWRWPEMYEAYRTECREGRLRPGGVFMWKAPDKIIFNLGTQPRPGPTAKLEYVHAAVSDATRIAAHESISIIGMPRIAAGNGGLKWSEVQRVLESIAAEASVVLAVYELPGRPG